MKSIIILIYNKFLLLNLFFRFYQSLSDLNVFRNKGLEENNNRINQTEKNLLSIHSYIHNNKSYHDEKFSKKKKNDKLSSLIEREIPNYIKSFKNEIEKTLSEINNIESKDHLYTLESKYEQLILPDNNKSCHLRNSNFIYKANNQLDNENYFVSQNTKDINKIKSNLDSNKNSIFINNNIVKDSNSFEDLNIKVTENANFEPSKLNNKISNKLSLFNDNNNKYDYNPNIIYLNNFKSKSQRHIQFDIHIKDAVDSAFEKLIID